MAILTVIIILVVLIVVHEFGHFIVAKLLGVRVDEFGIGYPPRAYTLGRFSGTEYTLNWLPFGGFVRLFGENTEEVKDDPERGKALSHASYTSQALILIAGVVANALFAWVLFTGSFMTGMLTAVPEDTPDARVLISNVLPDSPAENAGLTVGDELISIAANGEESAADVTPSAITEFSQMHGGEVVTLTYQRGEEVRETDIIPAHAVLETDSGRPALGIALTSVAEMRLPFFEALQRAGTHTLQSFQAVTAALAGLLWDAVSGGANLENLVGPVGLVGVVGESTTYGIGYLLGLAAFISVNLAIINLIPIPALDGGRLVFVALEAALRRPVSPAIVNSLNVLGFSFVILLMIAVTYNDIVTLLR